jgi:hypothetical protein
MLVLARVMSMLIGFYSQLFFSFEKFNKWFMYFSGRYCDLVYNLPCGHLSPILHCILNLYVQII